MEGNYPLDFGGKTVGKAQVHREGLYWRFQCRCELPGEVISKVLVCCGDQKESLGILVPMGGGFGLDTRLPVKRLGEGNWQFLIVPSRRGSAYRYVPIKPEEPFAYIAKLKDAYLALHEGQACAVLKAEEL